MYVAVAVRTFVSVRFAPINLCAERRGRVASRSAGRGVGEVVGLFGGWVVGAEVGGIGDWVGAGVRGGVGDWRLEIGD